GRTRRCRDKCPRARTPAASVSSSQGLALLFELLGECGSRLATRVDEHHAVIAALAVDEMTEPLQRLRILDGLPPLALVGVHDSLHVGLEFRADPQAVLADHLP